MRLQIFRTEPSVTLLKLECYRVFQKKLPMSRKARVLVLLLRERNTRYAVCSGHKVLSARPTSLQRGKI